MPDTAKDCHYFDKDDCHYVGMARGIAGLVIITVSITALIVIFVLRAFRKYPQRLFLYLTIATLFHAPIYIMEVMAVECKNKGNIPRAKEPLCTITGTLDMSSSWLQNLMVLWISGYLFRVVVLRKVLPTKKIELIFLPLFLVVSFAPALIPLIHNTYGVDGAWCWITAYQEDSCHKINYWGLGYQIGLWYVPFFIETVFVLVTVISITVTFINRVYINKNYKMFRNEYKRQLKESLPLLIFPVVYCILNIFEIGLDLVGIKFTNIYWLWMIDAVMNPLKAILVVSGYLVSIIIVRYKGWRKSHKKKLLPQEQTPSNWYGSTSFTILSTEHFKSDTN